MFFFRAMSAGPRAVSAGPDDYVVDGFDYERPNERSSDASLWLAQCGEHRLCYFRSGRGESGWHGTWRYEPRNRPELECHSNFRGSGHPLRRVRLVQMRDDISQSEGYDYRGRYVRMTWRRQVRVPPRSPLGIFFDGFCMGLTPE